MNRIEMKIGRMRKPQNFLVYKATMVGEGRQDIIVQSNKAIGQLNTETGELRFTTKGCYFPHLAYAEVIDIPEDLKETIIEKAGGY